MDRHPLRCRPWHGRRAATRPPLPSTLSADRRTLYLICFDPPRESIALRGLRTPVATVVGAGSQLPHRIIGGHEDIPGVLWIDAPSPTDLDPYATVVALELAGELDIYDGPGRA